MDTLKQGDLPLYSLPPTGSSSGSKGGGGYLPLGLRGGGICLKWVSASESGRGCGHLPPWTHTHTPTWSTSGRYASYWNAFLLGLLSSFAVKIFSHYNSVKSRYCTKSKCFLSLTEYGRVFCFGWNAHGQLGLGDTVLRDSPTELRHFGCGSPVQEAPERGEGDTLRKDSHCWLKRGRTVVDVFAGVWNTVFVVKTHPNTDTNTEFKY